MRYLKTYEELNIEINKYYLIEFDDMKYKSKCISISTKRSFLRYTLLVLNEENEFFVTSLNSTDILKELTPEEIKEFEIQVATKKYNI